MTEEKLIDLARVGMGIHSPNDPEYIVCDALIKALAQRKWIGLTEKDFSAINQSCLTKLQAAASAESILKEKNT